MAQSSRDLTIITDDGDAVSSELILECIMKSYPQVNLGRELMLARIYNDINRLRTDLRVLHDLTQSMRNIISQSRVGYCNELKSPYIMIIVEEDKYLNPKRPQRVYDVIASESYCNLIAQPFTGPHITISLREPDDLTEDDLRLIRFLSVHSIDRIHNNMSWHRLDNDVVSKFSLIDRFQNIETIEKIRSYPEAIDRVLEYCQVMSERLQRLREDYSTDLIDSMLRDDWNRVSGVTSPEGFSRRSIRIEYHQRCDVDPICYYILRKLGEHNIEEISNNPTIDGGSVIVTLKDSCPHVERDLAEGLNKLCHLRMMSSLTYGGEF